MNRILIAVAVFVCAAGLSAQETVGRLQGRVLTEANAPLSSAMITFVSASAAGGREVRANDRGYFVAEALPPGEYEVHVRALGFRPLIAQRVLVGLGLTTSLGIVHLRRSDVVLAPVVVTYDAMSTDPLSTEIASRLDVRATEPLPIGRDYVSIVQLLPQVQPGLLHRDGLNVAGSTGLENAFYIDGINVTEGYRHAGGTNLPHSFIDQVELKTGGYEAEFGRALGGIISVTTRSGTNTPFVSAFSYYTASTLASSTTRSSTFAKGTMGRYDVGVALGGPVVRDRLWYFAAYDMGVTRENVRLDGLEHVDRARAHQFAGKITWRADHRTHVNATVVGDPSSRDVVGHSFWGGFPISSLTNADAFLGFWDQGSIAASLSANRTIGERLLLEAHASIGSATDRTGPATSRGATDPLFVDFITGEWSGGYGNRWDRRSTRGALSLAAAVNAGPHHAKVGVQYEDNRQNENWIWMAGGPNGTSAIFRAAPDGYIGLILDHQARTRNRIPTLYAQTSILAHERLRLNAGLRWEGQYLHSPTTGRSSAITDQLQPRLGLIVYPTSRSAEKITASFGRFYEQLSNLPVTWYWGAMHQDVFQYAQDPRVDPTRAGVFSFDDVPGENIEGQHFDELTLGYDRPVLAGLTLAIRGSRRRLRQMLTGMFRPTPTGVEYVLANPGRGDFAAMPIAKARYDALEISITRLAARTGAFAVSYVLSKKWGNYPGLFDLDNGNPNPHASDVSVSEGLLPNDRTHLFKAFGSYTLQAPLTLGATFIAQSGTPLSELGALTYDPTFTVFLSPRGARGRTPFTWDLNLRGSYAPRIRRLDDTRFIVDVLHAFSQRKAIRMNQVQFLAQDANGNPIAPNPFYRTGLQFQPPTTLRFGVEIGNRSGRSGAGT